LIFPVLSGVSIVLLGGDHKGAQQRLSPAIPLCLLLETLDGITDLGVIVATRAVLLPQHPPPRRLLKKPASCGRMEQRH
jgi:hypothetical protein